MCVIMKHLSKENLSYEVVKTFSVGVSLACRHYLVLHSLLFWHCVLCLWVSG